MDCEYIFPIQTTVNGIPFGCRINWNSVITIQIWFHSTRFSACLQWGGATTGELEFSFVTNWTEFDCTDGFLLIIFKRKLSVWSYSFRFGTQTNLIWFLLNKIFIRTYTLRLKFHQPEFYLAQFQLQKINLNPNLVQFKRFGDRFLCGQWTGFYFHAKMKGIWSYGSIYFWLWTKWSSFWFIIKSKLSVRPQLFQFDSKIKSSPLIFEN